MAWIDKRQRTDGGTSYTVRWRAGGTRTGKRQSETFGAGPDEQNSARAEGFRLMVLAAGEDWPDGWVKGRGFVRELAVVEEPAAVLPRTVEDVGLEYVEQLVDCSPGQRSRYRAQLRLLKDLEVKGRRGRYRPFEQMVAEVTEDDVKAWLIGWDRSLKTKANYHGLLYGVFNFALERGMVAQNPLRRTAPKHSKVKQSQADLRFLTEHEFGVTANAAKHEGNDLITVTAGTGLRYGEVTALWVSDIDLDHQTVRINKAWKTEGENGEQDVPAWLAKVLKPKHAMRDHYLGNPKTPKSKRTITVSDRVAAVLARRIADRAPDDFVFVTPTGLPLHHDNFFKRVWAPLMVQLGEQGISPFRFHDLRHTHVAWLIAGGVPLPHIQARLGHESITTTIDTYGHLLPAGDDLISRVVDAAIEGKTIRPAPIMRLVDGTKRASAG